MSRRHASRRGIFQGEQLERRDCPAAMFSLELPQSPILEGDTPSFNIRLSEPSSRPERVLISTVAETATLGRDYFVRNNLQVLFAPGDTVKTFSIRTFSDSLSEGSETFRLVAAPLNRPSSQQMAATVRIWDVAPTTLTVSGGSIVEGDSGRKNAVFSLTLQGSPILPVTVSYATANGTAMAGSDYEARSGTITFMPFSESVAVQTQFTQTVSVPIIGDRTGEADETFSLVLSNASRGCTIRGNPAVFTIVNDERDELGFQITLTYDNPTLPAAQRVPFERAVARLQQIIVGDVPGVTVGGTFIDDMEIRVFVEAMPPTINGYASPTAFRPGVAGLPYLGEIHINSARIGNPGIYHTIIHEIVHALGFLPEFFTAANTINGLGTAEPLFTGTNAVREYSSIFGLTSPAGVPLYEDVTAQGSYAAHWSTNVFGTEIMSVGWNTASTALRPFSRITVGALDDIGYDVNYAAADAFSPPPDQITAALEIARRSTPATSRRPTVAAPSQRAPGLQQTSPVHSIGSKNQSAAHAGTPAAAITRQAIKPTVISNVKTPVASRSVVAELAVPWAVGQRPKS